MSAHVSRVCGGSLSARDGARWALHRTSLASVTVLTSCIYSPTMSSASITLSGKRGRAETLVNDPDTSVDPNASPPHSQQPDPKRRKGANDFAEEEEFELEDDPEADADKDIPEPSEGANDSEHQDVVEGLKAAVKKAKPSAKEKQEQFEARFGHMSPQAALGTCLPRDCS